MDLSVAWGPCDEFQLANWSFEEPVAAGLPVPVAEYTSIDIFGACCSPQAAYVPESSGGQELVQFHSYYSAVSPSVDTSSSTEVVGVQNGDETEDSRVSRVFNQVEDAYKADIDMMKVKMHRYPASLRCLDKSYTVPRYVAIGPYHRHHAHLKKAGTVKHAAAIRCVRKSGGRRLQEIYDALVPVADAARCLYDKDVMVDMANDDAFRHMMFFDACFLVQFMLLHQDTDRSLFCSLLPNEDDFFHDVMLLENQIPWMVVDKVMRLLNASWISKAFISRSRYCMMPYDHRKPPEPKPFIWYEGYNPPHLLGLLRYYIVGRRCVCDIDEEEKKLEPKNMSFSASAMDLAEIGITLKANKTMQLIDMHLNQKGAVFTELCLAPLSLDRDRASYLINMVALELCVVENFAEAKEEDSAVCSYVLLLANLVYRKEEVQELRERGIMQRGGGLTNEEALRFFSNFQLLRMGPRYYRIMQEIAIYRENSLIKTELHGFFHNNKKAIAAVVTSIGVVGGIIGTLLSIKKSI